MQNLTDAQLDRAMTALRSAADRAADLGRSSTVLRKWRRMDAVRAEMTRRFDARRAQVRR
jgi:hypothetical protein